MRNKRTARANAAFAENGIPACCAYSKTANTTSAAIIPVTPDSLSKEDTGVDHPLNCEPGSSVIISHSLPRARNKYIPFLHGLPNHRRFPARAN